MFLISILFLIFAWDLETSRREDHDQIKRLGKNPVKKGRKISPCKDGKWPTRMWKIWTVHILKDPYGCKVGAGMEGRIFSRFSRNWGVLIVLEFFRRERWPDFWKDTPDFCGKRWPDFGRGYDGIFEEGCTRFLNGDAPDFGEERTPILIRIKVQLHHWEDDHQPTTPFLIHFQCALKRGKENWQQHWHPDSWTSMIGPPPICASILHPRSCQFWRESVMHHKKGLFLHAKGIFFSTCCHKQSGCILERVGAQTSPHSHFEDPQHGL